MVSTVKYTGRAIDSFSPHDCTLFLSFLKDNVKQSLAYMQKLVKERTNEELRTGWAWGQIKWHEDRIKVIADISRQIEAKLDSLSKDEPQEN